MSNAIYHSIGVNSVVYLISTLTFGDLLIAFLLTVIIVLLVFQIFRSSF